MAESTTWPRPVRWRACSATIVPRAANVAASASPSDTPARDGGRSASPVTYLMPPIASPMEPNPARGAYGPVWPNPVTRVMTSPGLISQSCSGARPQRSSVPGLKFSSSTSDRAASRRTRSWPRGSRRLAVTDFLFRATTGHHSDIPCVFSRPHWRIGSPCPGSSTLMTSAPKSPSNWPQNGPASSWPSSVTRRSCSGVSPSGRGLVWSVIATSSGCSGKARRRSIACNLSRDRIYRQDLPGNVWLIACKAGTMMEDMSALEIVEVGPRDGLQNEDAVLDVAAKVAYIEALAAAGLRRIEAVSFVHPARVPQMAGAEAVMAAVPRPDGVRYSGLVLNRRGMERAVAAGVDEINMVVVATDTFSAKNQGMTTAEAIRATAGIAAAARDAGLRVTLTVGAAFGCPFEGEVRPERVTDIVRQCTEAGVNEVALADTIGVAVPRDVSTLAGAVRGVTDAPLRCHFHNTRNTGYANALAAIEAGVTVLDASAGGIGGCPFAPGATGNIATEDLLYALDRSGIGTGIDMAALLAASAYVEQRLGHANPALLGRAGMFPALRSSLVRAAEPWRWSGTA